MAEDDRYGYDRDRFRSRDDRRERDRGFREDDGYIARRGFGNSRSGYEGGRDDAGRSGFERGGSFRRDEDRYAGGRERDFGDSAGYGSGGSTRDWRDVMGEDRSRGGMSYGTGYDRRSERGYAGGYGAGPREDNHGRYGSSDFGRGSRGDHDERGFLERAGDEIRSWFGDDDAERRRGQDARMGDAGAQHHRGRGPKGYQRSDERIREDVNDRLTDDPHVDASEIEVTVQNREVTLTGTVNSRFEKRHAEDLAESISGVAHVQNNLRVAQSAGIASSMGAGSLGGEAPGAGSRVGDRPDLQSHGTGSTGSRANVVGGAAGTGLGGEEIPSTGDTGRGRRRG